MKTKQMTKRQKQVLGDFVAWKALNKKSAIAPCGADVKIAQKLEQMGIFKSVQKYPKNHPYRTGATFGYEVKHYYAGKEYVKTIYFK
jgi:hypothetical protein